MKNIKNFFKDFLKVIFGTNIKLCPDARKFYFQCKERPDIFINNCTLNNYYFRRDGLNFYQRYILNAIKDNERTIIKMPRRSTKSTLVLLSALHYAIFNDGSKVAIKSISVESTKNLFRELAKLCKYLTEDKIFGDYIREIKAEEIIFNNDSTISSFLIQSDLTESWNVPDFIILDEFAFHEYDKETLERLDEIFLIKAKKVSIISSQKDQKEESYFNNLFEKSVTGQDKNNFVPISIHYRQIPWFDKEMRSEYINLLGETKFQQEYGN